MSELQHPRASEQALIGCVLISGGEALDVIDIRADDFESTAFALIFQRAEALRAENKTLDEYVIADLLPAFSAEVASAAASVWSWENAGAYAEQIAGYALRRRLKHAGQGIIQTATDPEVDPAALPDLTRTMLDTSIGNPIEGPLPPMRDRFAEMIRLTESQPETLPTPWAHLNATLGGGLSRGTMTVIGARPSVGKSAIALQIAHSLSQRGSVLFSTLEMGELEVTQRLWAQQARIPYARIKANTMVQFMYDRLNMWRAQDPQNIHIDAAPAQTIYDIRNRARSLARTGDLVGVVVDYIGLITDRENRGDKRYLHISEITRGLKLLSRELSIPVIACSQLNREVSRRSDSRPNLSDLRESGSIEQDADAVILLDRDIEAENADLVMHVAKNRQGQTGVIYLDWQGEFVRAVEKHGGVRLDG